jgi:tripartite ATP-independent transporter DctP family solute receptor
MKKAITLISFGMLLVMFFSMAFSVNAATTIKLAHVNAVTHAIHLSAEKFKALVEERSGGAIKVEVYPGSQLGNEKEIAEGVKMGTVDMVHISSGGLATFLPEMGVFDAAYIFRDKAHQTSVLRGAIGTEFKEKLVAKAGIRILQYYYQGERNVTTSKKAVYEPADIKGLKIRTPDVKSYVETVRAMGATPTPIAFNELFTALQLNLVDGQENPLPTILASKFYEVQKYVTLTRHMAAPGVLAMNEKLFQKFTADQKALILKAADDAMDYHNELITKQQDDAIAELKRLGMTVIVPTDAAMNEWRTMAKNTLPKLFEDVWGAGMYDRIVNTK